MDDERKNQSDVLDGGEQDTMPTGAKVPSQDAGEMKTRLYSEEEHPTEEVSALRSEEVVAVHDQDEVVTEQRSLDIPAELLKDPSKTPVVPSPPLPEALLGDGLPESASSHPVVEAIESAAGVLQKKNPFSSGKTGQKPLDVEDFKAPVITREEKDRILREHSLVETSPGRMRRRRFRITLRDWVIILLALTLAAAIYVTYLVYQDYQARVGSKITPAPQSATSQKP